MTLGLGMDTGGTYTDGVIMDLDSGEIVSKAKSPTTHEDLRIGIRGVLNLLDQELLTKVGVVSLSTTLATNAIVEGKGARVALLCIGNLYNNAVKTDYQDTVAGGHNLHGTEKEPFDAARTRSFFESIVGKVDSVAIVSYMAVRNPIHERQARDIAREVLGVPVVCGHELSSSLGFSDRVTTAAMNAALLPVMAELIDSVREMLDSHGINAPLMLVRGDGTMMGEVVARERPVEATASGPAASIIGAMNLSGRTSGIVMDTGGTTTDLGIFRDGRPRLSQDGAVIGGKRTKVTAVQISAVGLGGDTMFNMRAGRIDLGNVRAIPICTAATRWEQVRNEMRRPVGENPGSRVTEFVVAIGGVERITDPRERKMMDLMAVPLPPERVCSMAGTRPGELLKLISRGHAQWIGFTPTDMMHCTGEYVEFDADASVGAARALAARTGSTYESFLEECRMQIRRRVCRSIMSELVHESCGRFELGPGGEDMVEHAMAGGCKGYSCRLALDMPIVGMGAPARVFAGLVGDVFDTEVIVSEHSGVGNAVGAITSMVAESIDVLVKPVSARKDKGYEAFSRLGRFTYDTYEEAVEDSIDRACAYVRSAVARSGAEFPDITVDRKDTDIVIDDSGSPVTVQTKIKVSAAGKPKATEFTG